MKGVTQELEGFLRRLFLVAAFLVVVGILFFRLGIHSAKWGNVMIHVAIVGVALSAFAAASFSRIMDDRHFQFYFWIAWLIGFIVLGGMGLGSVAWLAVIAIPPLLSLDWVK